MTPTHARKGAARYRYYVSLALTKGRKAEAGSVCRVVSALFQSLDDGWTRALAVVFEGRCHNE